MDLAAAGDAGPEDTLEGVALVRGCDVQQVDWTMDPEDPAHARRALVLRLGHDAAQRFEDVTRRYAYAGRRLLVKIQGKVVAEPKILDPVVGGVVLVTGTDDADVETLHRQLAAAASP
jgi:hypothetical protein